MVPNRKGTRHDTTTGGGAAGIAAGNGRLVPSDKNVTSRGTNPGEERAFLRRLFDLSFNDSVSGESASLLYILVILFTAVLSALVVARAILTLSFTLIAVSLVYAPLGFFCVVLMIRLGLETVIAVVRIRENTDYIVRRVGPDGPGSNSSAGGAPTRSTDRA